MEKRSRIDPGHWEEVGEPIRETETERELPLRSERKARGGVSRKLSQCVPGREGMIIAISVAAGQNKVYPLFIN